MEEVVEELNKVFGNQVFTWIPGGYYATANGTRIGIEQGSHRVGYKYVCWQDGDDRNFLGETPVLALQARLDATCTPDARPSA